MSGELYGMQTTTRNMEATSNTKQQMWFPEELWCKIKDYNTIPKKPEKPHPICRELNFIFKEQAWNLLIYENLYDDNDTYDYDDKSNHALKDIGYKNFIDEWVEHNIISFNIYKSLSWNILFYIKSCDMEDHNFWMEHIWRD